MQKLENKFKEVNKRLNNDINFIIQAFINFYGTDNSEYIVDKIKDSRVIWYDESSDMNDNIYNHIISSLPKDELDRILKERKKEAFLQSVYIDEFDVLVLPLSYDLTKIIHEINHKIGSHIVSRKPLIQISGISYSVEKNGIIEYDNDLNEAINQKMTLEIIEELEKIGLKVEVTPSWQENLFPVIDSFYSAFKDNLKELNVSGNLLKFRESLGDEYFSQFSQLIFMCGFKARRTISKKEKVDFSDDKINAIDNLVLKMKEYHDSLLQNNGKKSYK